MGHEAIAWERFEWRSGADRYRFEIGAGGLFGTLSAEASANCVEQPVRSMTLPMVAWDGLLDSLKVNRKSRDKPSAVGLPPRAGARWTPVEIAGLEEGFKAGRKIPELAQGHARTVFAIESQLEKMGLWQRPHDIRTS